MKITIYRYFSLLLPLILTRECVGETVLLTLMGDKCITNISSGMAMLYDLSDPFLENYKQLNMEVSEFKSKEVNERGLEGMCSNLECFDHENSDSWYYMSSLVPVTNNLITDRRWEDFPTIVTRRPKQVGDYLEYQLAATISNGLDNNNFAIPFSVQAKNAADIYLCDGDEVPRSICYWIVLQAVPTMALCEEGEIPTLHYDGQQFTTYCSVRPIYRTYKPAILKEDRWNHFKIVKKGSAYSLLDSADMEILGFSASDYQITPTKLFFGSKTGTVLWKVHDFNYFYTEKAEVSLQSKGQLTISKGTNCFSMFVTMCKLCSMEMQFFTYHSIYRNTRSVTATLKLEDEKWTEVKTCFNMYTEGVDNMYFKIVSKHGYKNNFWAFSNLRASREEEIRVLTPAYPKYWKRKCQLLNFYYNVLDLNGEEVSVLKNWHKCTETQFGEDCLQCDLVYENICPRNTKYCQLIYKNTGIEHRCYCSIGNSGDNCEKNCSNIFHYGHSCQNYCPNCLNGCNTVSGNCVRNYDGEKPFSGEKFDEELRIYILDQLPDIEIGYTSCSLKVHSFSGKFNPEKEPLFYKFQYKQLNEKTWKDVTNEPQEFYTSTKIELQNLKSQTWYSIRVFGFNSDEDLKHLDLMSEDIPFKTIKTKCYDISENKIKIEPEGRSARILIDSHEGICDLSNYFLVFNATEYNLKTQKNILLTELESFTEYSITLNKKGGNSLFKKIFQTKESEDNFQVPPANSFISIHILIIVILVLVLIILLTFGFIIYRCCFKGKTSIREHRTAEVHPYASTSLIPYRGSAKDSRTTTLTPIKTTSVPRTTMSTLNRVYANQKQVRKIMKQSANTSFGT